MRVSDGKETTIDTTKSGEQKGILLPQHGGKSIHMKWEKGNISPPKFVKGSLIHGRHRGYINLARSDRSFLGIIEQVVS